MLESKLNGCQVVECGNQDIGEAGFRYSEPAGHRGGSVDISVIWGVGFHVDQRRVVQAVIATFKFYDLIAASGGASQADSMHSRFRTAVAETDHLDWKSVADFFRQLPLHIVGHAEHRARGKASFHRLHYCGVTMPSHERTETKIVIDVFVAVEVTKPTASSFFHKNRIGIVGAIVARHSQRNTLEVLLVSFSRFRGATLEDFELFLQCRIHQGLQKTQAVRPLECGAAEAAQLRS